MLYAAPFASTIAFVFVEIVFARLLSLQIVPSLWSVLPGQSIAMQGKMRKDSRPVFNDVENVVAALSHLEVAREQHGQHP